MTDRIAFTLNGRATALPPGTSPTMTLLDWLRGAAGLTGTKEGCAEGDCGACTVVLEEPDGGRVPINACLAMLGQMQGRAIRTVEGLRGADGAAHPVQLAMAESDGTQCGFCTPGIVMSAWAWTREGGDPHEALAGNLCRCTGYRPILEAMARMADDGAAAPVAGVAGGRFEAAGQVFHLPRSLPELLALRAAHPGAMLLAGGTDLGLLVSEHRQRPPEVICLLGVPELATLCAEAGGIEAGAAVSFGALLGAMEGGFAPFGALLRRLGSRQIRGMGTLGGNLGTASPIGDALPPLLALGARVRLASSGGVREMAVEEFLLGYRKTALGAGEVIVSVWLPRPPEGALLACEKLSKRHDQDIATVGLSALLRFDGEVVAEARVAFGGMGPQAARAPGVEAALLGSALDGAALDRAVAALPGDVSPLSDWRGSAGYRLAAAAGLLRRLALRRAGVPAEVMA
jgi:xanthine dehydrogenase small subunit